MIGIGTKLFDLNGSHTFSNNELVTEDLTTANAQRRLSKVKTLDAGVFIDDSGYVAGDTDINVTVRTPDKELYDQLKDIFIYHGFVYIASSSGNFLCVPGAIKLKNGNAVMSFMTKDNA